MIGDTVKIKLLRAIHLSGVDYQIGETITVTRTVFEKLLPTEAVVEIKGRGRPRKKRVNNGASR